MVPLADVIAWHAGGQDNLPPRALVLSVDDGHRSVYEVLWPMLKGRSVPVTLFVYPSAISNASYAMTWDQLRALAQSGTFDIESHTEWHPNFKTERARLAPAAYRRFVHDQLRRSRDRIEAELHRSVRLLAWPFGIYDTELAAMARDEGYTNGFSRCQTRHAAVECHGVAAIPHDAALRHEVPARHVAQCTNAS